MKRSLLLLLCCLTTWGASAQSALVPALDANTLEIARRVVFPAFALFLLGYFVLAAIRMVLNYLLKRQILASVVSESVVERLLPGPQSEQNQVVKWVALLLSTGAGLTACSLYLPLGLHSVIILIFSTALGFLAYYLFLRQQVK
ncbi:hypothetical protein E4631_22185 [Hymenobacter sp. UV11]|uniref:hypothetical protein n=1 Tax=Hymenobacter sp. UV11 TaxID=1849735 RepID=UPI0010609D2A|nr:hypothetical protein [Hymenobacter sp. UV11]TDN38631.1 hypothetical protein A8B98_22615 [Hymenobacter sp. UV11]TFZ63545.1 hypothetical protein E4631_22185 [Hymenobacter sp. UV11]